ncbi:TonB-dependent receptor [Methylovirgula ligni]|uniref:Hemoglobin/transferrin/lactoferrin receptor protein n=1 Tax=Methylovirgula ligni TaxID=569860 RepID=A0A3D9YZX1_9HYPH|nr:TonB-dependent receptor [Methylovirgula ligni]QAY94788.1 TonB-dependent receptor [Methylovirgula ligni]REF87310.1 hemoglobin/transferrin/lactoferrin receptor protein [Methylovirgula ligni]
MGIVMATTALTPLNAARSQEAGTSRPQTLPQVEVTTQGGPPSKAHPIVGPIGGNLPKPKSLRQVTQNVSVVDRQQLELTNPPTLLDALGQVPGVEISRTGGLGGQIYLRGFSTNNWRVPLFVDGDRLQGRNTLQLAYFQPDEIEQIDVIRGPASVLYGSDAMGGLINVIMRHPTADPDGPFRFAGGGVSFGFGSNGTALSNYQWVEAAGLGFNIRSSIGEQKSNSYETPNGLARNSDYRDLDAGLTIEYTPVANQHLSGTFHESIETDGRAGGVGGAPGYPYLQVRQSPNDLMMGRVDYSGDFAEGPFSHIEASGYIDYFDTHVLTLNTSSATKIVNSNSHVIGPETVGGRVLGVVVPLSGPGWGRLDLKVGADSFREYRPGSTLYSATETLATGAIKISPEAQNVPNSQQLNVGVFGLAEWTPIAPLTFSAGQRVDYFDTSSATSPLASPALLPAYESANNSRVAPTESIGAVVRLLPVFDLIGDIQTSFHEPTDTELFSSTASTIPNPYLKPETGLTYEGGFRFHTGDATLTATAYHSVYQNLILTVPVTYDGLNTYTQQQNAGDAQIDGIEIEERWQATPSINLFANITAIRGTNTTTGVPLPYISPLRGRTGIQYAPPDSGYSVEGVVNWAAAKTRIDPSQELSTSGYAVANLYATLQLGKLVSPALGDTRLSLGVENIFDTAYADAATFANVAYDRSVTNPLLEPGRNFTVKVTHTF